MLSKILPAIAVLIISSALFLTRLGANSLADWDEAWYADASRFMFRQGHFFTPIWNNHYFFDKPPLQYWLTQPFLYLLGETELAYRLPPALAAIGLTLVTYLWGKKRSGVFAGLTAAAILLSFPHFLDRGRSGNFDSLFILFTTLSMFLMMKNRPALGGIFLGLSWLTKGVFSGLFPIIALLVFKGPALRSKAGPYQNIKPLLIYLFTAIIIYTPWHLLEYVRFEELIEKSYFAASDQGEFGDRSWMSIARRFDLRYLVFLWTFLRWWFPILLISLAWRFYPKITTHNSQLTTFYTNQLPFITFITIFLALSAAKTKNDWYITPAYPFIALMITDALGSLQNFLSRNAVSQTSPNSRFITFITFITIIPFSAANLLRHWNQAFPPDKWLPEKELGLTVKNLTNPDDLIVTAEYEFPSLRYYSEREVRTAARQPDYEGKYWWIWDNVRLATALRRGRDIVTIHRPGTQWPIDVYGYHREKLGESNNRIISRLLPNTPP